MPVVLCRRGAWKLDDNPAHRNRDTRAKLEQMIYQTVCLCPRASGALRLPTNLLKEREGSDRKEDTELIGQESMAACAIERHRLFEFLDAVLRIASTAVEVPVDRLGAAAHIGDEKARIVPNVSAGIDDDLRLENDTTLSGPFPRLVLELGVVTFRVAALPETTSDTAHEFFPFLEQNLVFGQIYGIFDKAPLLQLGQDFLACESSVEPDLIRARGNAR